jgi:hypothetical protein
MIEYFVDDSGVGDVRYDPQPVHTLWAQHDVDLEDAL